MIYYFLFLALFAVRKIMDQLRSRRNVCCLVQQRQLLPNRDRAFPWMLITHITFFVLTPLEILLLDREFIPVLGIPMIMLFVLAMLLRWWSTALLGKQWTSQVVVPGD